MSYYDDASLVLIPSGVKALKVYSQKPTNGTGDFTFGRASTATRTNASGAIVSVASNVPRLDYMTATGTLATCPMLEAEQQRTNLALQSEAFDGASWTKIAITATANTTTSPDGTTNADTISIGVDGSAARHRLLQAFTLTIGTTYTGTYYLKANAHNWIQIVAVSGFSANVWANFNLANGTIGNTGGVDTTASIENVGNGWYRCRVSGVATGTSSTGFEVIVINNTNGIRYPSYQSTQAQDVCYVWGAQLEVGSFPSTYIPTTTASVTRLKDDISISGASALIGQTEGTIFLDVDFRVVSSGGIRVFFALEASVANQFTGFAIGTTSDGNNVSAAGTAYALTQGRHKIVFRYNSSTNVSKLFVDGAQRGASTLAAFAATLDRISVLGRINPFASFVVDRQQFGGCNQFAIWKTALTDSECIELSTL